MYQGRFRQGIKVYQFCQLTGGQVNGPMKCNFCCIVRAPGAVEIHLPKS